ncbi:hypothetical protein BH09BAC5_BH09BAC5_12860 [soil metagenome]
MTKIIIILFTILSLKTFAQPVILDGSNIPVVGFSEALLNATPTSGIGNAGANQIWDFSTLSFSPMGVLSVITPASSPIGNSFPSSNHAFSLGSTYTFFNVSTNKMEIQAYFISSVGIGNDLTPNPETILKFPFNYLDTISDTWQSVSGPLNNVTLTYDGYGTLMTPTHTYTNIVRVKEDYGAGNIDYRWYSLNPLMFLVTYNHTANQLYYIDANISGLNEESDSKITATLFPNPATDQITIAIPNDELTNDLNFMLINNLGQKVIQCPITESATSIAIENLSSGIYFYQIKNNQNNLKSGKIIIQ